MPADWSLSLTAPAAGSVPVTIAPDIITVTWPALPPAAPLPPTATEAEPLEELPLDAAALNATLSPPLPPAPPIDCARTPTDRRPLVVMPPVVVTLTELPACPVPPLPPLAPAAPTDTFDAGLPADAVPVMADPPLPPLPPIDWATMPMDWSPRV
ncbi:hypothetical protein PIGHUM_04736 [Pigmentiphaga humi]|uniref:Uncharacterized protein n=1 Tax=Pigmentiphaga humi TaxID=2478468 RepID=A0A3P4B8M3_9BURK|nr:hypothetical protein PIGHUM_04736 [Pigmentiphaga humi]